MPETFGEQLETGEANNKKTETPPMESPFVPEEETGNSGELRRAEQLSKVEENLGITSRNDDCAKKEGIDSAGPRNIAEVRAEIRQISEEFVKKGDRPIDNTIEDLLVGLRRWNIDTKESCGGHRFVHPTQGSYPFVRFGKEGREVVEKILKQCPEGDHWAIAVARAQPDGSYMLYPKSQDYPPKSLLKYFESLFLLGSYRKSGKKMGEWLESLHDNHSFAGQAQEVFH